MPGIVDIPMDLRLEMMGFKRSKMTIQTKVRYHPEPLMAKHVMLHRAGRLYSQLNKEKILMACGINAQSIKLSSKMPRDNSALLCPGIEVGRPTGFLPRVKYALAENWHGLSDWAPKSQGTTMSFSTWG